MRKIRFFLSEKKKEKVGDIGKEEAKKNKSSHLCDN